MKKQSLIKLIIGSTSMLGLSASVISCGSHNNTQPDMSQKEVTVINENLINELKPLAAIVDPKITNLKVTKKDHLATGLISYTNKLISDSKINNYKNVPFSIKLEKSQTGLWITNDFNGLLNPAQKNFNNVSQLANSLVKNNDFNVQFPSGDKNLVTNYVANRIVKGSISSNIKLLNSASTVLTLNYRAIAKTTSITDKASRIAYTYDLSQSYDLTTGKKLGDHQLTNIDATLTEATVRMATHAGNDNPDFNFNIKTMSLTPTVNYNELNMIYVVPNSWTIHGPVGNFYTNKIIAFNNNSPLNNKSWSISNQK